ncbi:hypothetical protein D3C75_1338080 [compost metagenome]
MEFIATKAETPRIRGITSHSTREVRSRSAGNREVAIRNAEKFISAVYTTNRRWKYIMETTIGKIQRAWI